MSKCKCQIIQPGAEGDFGLFSIEYCPLHAAAGELLEASKLLITSLDAKEMGDSVITLAVFKGMDKLGIAIKKAEGRRDD